MARATVTELLEAQVSSAERRLGNLVTAAHEGRVSQWYRMEHKVGGFAGAYDWKRRVIMFVSRGVTAYFDLAEIEREMQRQVGMLGE